MAAGLLKTESHPAQEQELILENVLLTVLPYIIQTQPLDLYEAHMAQELLQTWELLPKEKYRILTTNGNLDADENQWMMQNLIQTANGENQDPDEWTLGNLAQELLENLKSWYNLNPESPELQEL
jgi:hypothetical protein